MGDMSAIIVPKSDQINADDLLGRTMTITVSDVKIRGGQEQPISIEFEGSDKVFRPCKSMCRVMAQAWGLDSKLYIGRSMTLYCDPTVKFGPLAVGGIRISHMTNIDGPMVMALTATKGVKKSYKVLPLEVRAPVAEEPFTIAQARADMDAADDLDALKAIWSRRIMAPYRAELTEHLEVRKAELAGEGPADTQRGDAHDGAVAELIRRIEQRTRGIDLDSYLASQEELITSLSDEERAAVDAAAEARRAQIKAPSK